MSGTSMASAVMAGAVALLLQDEPDLTPNQVKHRLMATTAPFDGPEPGSTGAGYLDIYAAVHGTTTESANVGIVPHQLLAKMALIAFWASENGGDSIDWDSVNWDSVNWDSVNWDSVNWDSVNWDSVNWDSVNWDSVNWDSVNWDSVNWDSVNWDSVNWDSVNWDSVNWDSVNWDSVNWDD
jgi:serine protease AprX